jgi:parallel beta-helix repeat protein
MGKQSMMALLLLAVAGGTSTAQAQVNCGDTITTPAVLTEDLFCGGFDPALTIVGPEGSLDMRGFTVSCEGTTADGIELEGDGAVLRNGVVTSCGDGVRLQGENGRLSRMIVEDNSDVGVFVADDAGSGNLVRDTISRNNGDDGFSDFSAGGNTYERNVATGNELNGFQIGSISSGNTLRHNLAANNGLHGFEIDNDNHLVTQNVAKENEGDGFQIQESNNRVTLNLALKNLGDGIDVGLDGTGNILKWNVALGNGSTDLEGDGGFDLEDDNPDCDNNTWRGNLGRRNQPDCIQ